MNKIIISFMLIIGLTNCEKDKNQTHNTGLTGKWEWTRTDGGFGFHIHETPSNSGNSYLLQISDGNTISIYANDIEIFSGTFKIEKRESIYSGEEEDYLKIIGDYHVSEIVISGIIKIEQNTLAISDNFYDGLGSYYIKKE